MMHGQKSSVHLTDESTILPATRGTMVDTKTSKQSAEEKKAAARAASSAAPIDLRIPSLYINRELSHIEFHRRVLHETEADHPLLEKVKFLAIYNSNIDEFFMVRVSGLRQQMRLGVSVTPPDGLLPREQLANIHRTLTQLFVNPMESGANSCSLRCTMPGSRCLITRIYRNRRSPIYAITLNVMSFRS